MIVSTLCQFLAVLIGGTVLYTETIYRLVNNHAGRKFEYKKVYLHMHICNDYTVYAIMDVLHHAELQDTYGPQKRKTFGQSEKRNARTKCHNYPTLKYRRIPIKKRGV